MRKTARVSPLELQAFLFQAAIELETLLERPEIAVLPNFSDLETLRRQIDRIASDLGFDMIPDE